MGKFCSDFAGLAEIFGEGKKKLQKKFLARALAEKKKKEKKRKKNKN
jgi:hypothetical protein